MPIYEYRCGSCRRRVSLLFRGFSNVGEVSCPRCGSQDLTRLVSRVAFHRSSGSSGEEFGGVLENFDENDPRAMARSLRAMSDETGEALDHEMEEALGRLEAGEDPESVMGQLDGDDDADSPLSYDDEL